MALALAARAMGAANGIKLEKVAADEKRRAAERQRDVLADRLDAAQACTVCFESPRSVLLQPCRHLVCCGVCAAGMGVCPVCRARVEHTVTGVGMP